jgi:membrane-associated protein
MNPITPLSAIIIYSLVLFWIYLNILPDPIFISEYLQSIDPSIIFFILFLIILIESIVYLWFYLPGQFIAVLLVTSYSNSITDVFMLTIVSILAVYISAIINYYLWYFLIWNNTDSQKTTLNYKRLLISMIHINTLALYIFDQWAKNGSKKIIYMAGLLNIPYYFLILFITYLLKNEILSISENIYLLYVILFSWLFYSLYINKIKKPS